MKLKWLSFILFFCFLFAGIGNGISFGGDECIGPKQSAGGTFAGFGEYDYSDGKGAVRFRGQTFIAEDEYIGGITFDIKKKGYADLRVFLYSVKEDGFTPDHEVYSWTIPNDEIKKYEKRYELPEKQNLTIGKLYVFYFAPYKDGVYSDDYRDMVWSLGDPYPNGKGVVNINGCWTVSDNGCIDLLFKIDNGECEEEPTPTPTEEPTPTPTGTEEPTPIPTPTGNGGGGGGDDGGGGGGGGKELRVISTNPTKGTTNVDPDLNKIEVSFNLAMDESGFITTSAMVLKEKESGTEITLSYVVVSYGGKVTFGLTSGSLVSGTEYEVKVIKDRVKAGVGEFPTLKEDYIWTFTTTTKAQPTPTPTPTVTIEPTPSPSPNPSPTSSSSPTPTPTPSVEPSPIFTPTPIPTPTSSADGVIYGRVRDFHEGNPPLAGVTVALTKREDGGWNKYAVEKTKKNGKYQFEELPPGFYKLVFSKPKWISITRKVRLKEGGKKEVNVLLDP